VQACVLIINIRWK